MAGIESVIDLAKDVRGSVAKVWREELLLIRSDEEIIAKEKKILDELKKIEDQLDQMLSEERSLERRPSEDLKERLKQGIETVKAELDAVIKEEKEIGEKKGTEEAFVQMGGKELEVVKRLTSEIERLEQGIENIP
ncbi:hypothetical protein GF351_00645 [Candidatus Woesearchaeota archaeon]|nr:hypothetical protein [Candidatus Woesearchaeota archaeon]